MPTGGGCSGRKEKVEKNRKKREIEREREERDVYIEIYNRLGGRCGEERGSRRERGSKRER